MHAKGVPVRSTIALLVLLGCCLAPRGSPAHPLGNFSISHYTSIRLAQDAIELRYLIDMAEIPTFQELQETGIVPAVDHSSLRTYLAHKSEMLRDGLLLEVNGQRLALQGVSSDILFPPGAGGLLTLKLGFLYRAPLAAIPREELYRLYYRDTNFPGRAGWQEIIAVAETGSTIVQSAVPTTDRSRELTDYPTDLVHSPPQVLDALVLFRRDGLPQALAAHETPALREDSPAPGTPQPVLSQATSSPTQGGSPALALTVNRQAPPRDALTTLATTQHLNLGVILVALGVAAGLGAFHALEPGHGKTVVAAYLVGTRGTARHAVYLGLLVTATHTAGVYVLGAVTLYASRSIVPERLYPWLGVLSGLTIAGLGGYLLLQRSRGAARTSLHEPSHPPQHVPGHASTHSHTHVHTETHHHNHPHEAWHHGQAHATHHHHHHRAGTTVSRREILVLGITGGIVPCPAALVVLLSAIALQRIGFGLLLIVAFSAGLAAVLIVIGLLMVYARHFMPRWHSAGSLCTRWLPLTSAAIVTVFGVAMTLQALTAAGILRLRL